MIFLRVQIFYTGLETFFLCQSVSMSHGRVQDRASEHGAAGSVEGGVQGV